MIITIGIEETGVIATIQMSVKEIKVLKSLVELGMTSPRILTSEDKMVGQQIVRNISRIKFDQ